MTHEDEVTVRLKFFQKPYKIAHFCVNYGRSNAVTFGTGWVDAIR